MKKTTRNGTQWTLLEQLGYLEFANDLSHKHSQMQDKTTVLESEAAPIRLKNNKEKTKVMRINANSKEPIVLKDGALEEVTYFTYL